MEKLVWVTAIIVTFSMMAPAQKRLSIVQGEPNYSVAPETEASATFSREMLDRQAADRNLALRRDTDKLLELASQLKQNVDHTNPNLLSLDVIRKAQEIEKLAKSVREKMKGD